MKPRYIIVDRTKRDAFEREWQVPYGYNGCHIFLELKSALETYSWLTTNKTDYIIEKYDSGKKKEVVI